MNGRDNRDDHLFLWCAFLILVFVLLPALYIAHADSVNRPLLALAKAQIQVFTPFFDEAQTAWTRIAEADPSSLSWETMQKVLRYTGSWIRWPFALLLVLFGVAAIFMGRVGSLVRRFNMESLLRNNAESFPCLRPVVGRGKYLLLPESHDSGPWKIARTPVQFALENELLLDEQGKAFTPEQALKNGLPSTELPAWGNARLDEKKALAVLTEQLGKPFEGYEGLSPCRRALAVAFLAYANGDKKNCISILDMVSCSYNEIDGNADCPVLTDSAFEKRLKKHGRGTRMFCPRRAWPLMPPMSCRGSWRCCTGRGKKACWPVRSSCGFARWTGRSGMHSINVVGGRHGPKALRHGRTIWRKNRKGRL